MLLAIKSFKGFEIVYFLIRVLYFIMYFVPVGYILDRPTKTELYWFKDWAGELLCRQF